MQLNASQIAAVIVSANEALRQVLSGSEPDFYRDFAPALKRRLREQVEAQLGNAPVTVAPAAGTGALYEGLFVGIVWALRGAPEKIRFEQELQAAGSPGEVVEPEVADEKKIVEEKPEAPKKPRAKKKAAKKKAKS